MRKFITGLVLIVIGFALLMIGFRGLVGRNIDAISKMKAEGMINKVISETVKEKFSDESFEKNLFITESGKDGVKTIQANTRLINQMISDFSSVLQDKYDCLDAKRLKVPLGAVLGSKVISQSGMGIWIKVLPMSVYSCDFQTSFSTEGINQTKYKIFLTVKSKVRILQPFSSENITISTKILIGEMVIVGNVPDSYVNVPKDEILDAIN